MEDSVLITRNWL